MGDDRYKRRIKRLEVEYIYYIVGREDEGF